MHINLLNHNNIEGKGLSVLLGNEGHQVELIPQQRKRMNNLSTKSSSSFFLINVDFLLETDAERILKEVNSDHAVLLLGELSQLHWLAEFSTRKKGFVCKNSSFTDLLDILHCIGESEIILDQYAQLFLQKSCVERQSLLLQKELAKPLSDAELSLMREISQGKTTKQIAQEQYLSIHTIYNHRKNIKQKFQCSDNLKLSKFCMLLGEAIKTLILADKNTLSNN